MIANRLVKLAFLVLPAMVAFGNVASAASIGVQFAQNEAKTLLAGESAGVPAVAQVNWNPLVGGSFSNVPLNDQSGPTTAVLASASGGSYFASSNMTAGDFKLSSSALLSTGGTQTLTVNTIPYANYDVYVYGTSDNDTRRISLGLTSNAVTTYRSFKSTTASTSWVEGTGTWDGTGPAPTDQVQANYVHFSNLSSGTFSLSWFSPDNSGINGFQIVEVAAVPEPMVLGTAVLGLAAGALRRRSR